MKSVGWVPLAGGVILLYAALKNRGGTAGGAGGTAGGSKIDPLAGFLDKGERDVAGDVTEMESFVLNRPDAGMLESPEGQKWMRDFYRHIYLPASLLEPSVDLTAQDFKKAELLLTGALPRNAQTTVAKARKMAAQDIAATKKLVGDVIAAGQSAVAAAGGDTDYIALAKLVWGAGELGINYGMEKQEAEWKKINDAAFNAPSVSDFFRGPQTSGVVGTMVDMPLERSKVYGGGSHPEHIDPFFGCAPGTWKWAPRGSGPYGISNAFSVPPFTWRKRDGAVLDRFQYEVETAPKTSAITTNPDGSHSIGSPTGARAGSAPVAFGERAHFFLRHVLFTTSTFGDGWVLPWDSQLLGSGFSIRKQINLTARVYRAIDILAAKHSGSMVSWSTPLYGWEDPLFGKIIGSIFPKTPKQRAMPGIQADAAGTGPVMVAGKTIASVGGSTAPTVTAPKLTSANVANAFAAVDVSTQSGYTERSYGSFAEESAAAPSISAELMTREASSPTPTVSATLAPSAQTVQAAFTPTPAPTPTVSASLAPTADTVQKAIESPAISYAIGTGTKFTIKTAF